MSKKIDETFLNETLRQMTEKRNNFGAVLNVEQGNNGLSWIGSSGNLGIAEQYFITSVTKLYVTAVVLQLRADNRLQLEDRITNYLSEDIVRGIHVLDGIEYSNDITIKHLISNTSGIPDYFSCNHPNGKTVAAQLFNNQDEEWHLDKTLDLVKEQKPKFKPGKKGKVNYSDTNYQLLGRIIENITGLNMADVFKTFIFDDLGLTKTYVYEDAGDSRPVPFYYKSSELNIPRYMSSVTPEGGIVSTAKETMVFLKAFFNGRFFPKEELEELKQWNMIYFPGQFYYGVGLEKLWVPRIISPIKPIKEILGFWGQSGAFAFYNPEQDIYFTGTVNQSSGLGHSAAHKAMLKTVKATYSYE